jgi:ribosomal protein S18 acetylase RimI-like enzyme
MSEITFRIELLQKQDRLTFDCGEPELNAYFHTRVGQDVRRNYTTCFVAMDQAEGRIAGYYTLAMGSVPLGELPEDVAKRLPRYPQVPFVHIGRLAVDQNYQGQKLGGSLLADAIARSVGSEIAAYAVVVDAKNNTAAAFYEHFGFLKLRHSSRTLFLPISKSLKNLVNK